MYRCGICSLFLLVLSGILRIEPKINAGAKEESAIASAYHMGTADDLESDAIESKMAISSVSLVQVRAPSQVQQCHILRYSHGCRNNKWVVPRCSFGARVRRILLLRCVPAVTASLTINLKVSRRSHSSYRSNLTG